MFLLVYERFQAFDKRLILDSDDDDNNNNNKNIIIIIYIVPFSTNDKYLRAVE